MTTIKECNGRIFIPREVRREQLEGIPATWSKKRGCWVVYASEEATNAINLKFGTVLKPWAVRERGAIYPFLFKTRPRNHQSEALFAAEGRAAFGYFMDPGLGKTKVTIDEAQILNDKGQLSSVCVVCPKTVIDVWCREILKHGRYEQWEVYRWDEQEFVTQPENDDQIPKLRWLIINYDSLVAAQRNGELGKKSSGYNSVGHFLNGGRSMLVADESFAIKTWDSKRHEAMAKLGKLADYRRILNGTPSPNSPLELYGQLWFLDPEIVYGWSWYAFRDHFAIMGGYDDKDVIGYRNMAELQTMMHANGYVAKLEQCVDLPPKVYEQRLITLTPATRAAYNELVEELTTEVNDYDISAEWVMTRITKVRQMTGGAVYSDSGVEVHFSNEKMNALLDIAHEIGTTKKMLVWCQFTHEVDRITAELRDIGRTVVKLDGRDSAAERGAAVAAFEEGNTDTMVLQNDAGCQGITLNAAHYVVYFTNSLSNMVRYQSEQRCHRIGQTKSVVYFDLIARGTVDESVHASLMHKQDLSQFITSSSRALTKEDLKRLLGRRPRIRSGTARA